MKIRKTHIRLARLGALLFCFSGSAFAVQLKENNAYIEQGITIPGMTIAINPGGTGCNAGNNEKWEASEGGCSNIEYLKKTAQVISVVAAPASILADNIAASILSATVRDEKGLPLGAGIPVAFANNHGNLSSLSAITNSNSVATVTLRGPIAGAATVTAKAAAGSTKLATVVLVANPATATVTQLTASPSTIQAGGTETSTLSASVVDANNNPLGSGVPVSFTTTFGTLSSSMATTNTSGIASVLISGSAEGEATVAARAAAGAGSSAKVRFESLAPVLNSITATKIYSGPDTTETPSTVKWNGTGLSATTTYKITVTPYDHCIVYGPLTFTPNPGSTTWRLAPRQTGSTTGMLAYSHNQCTRYATLQACNGPACTSKNFSIDNYVGTSSM